MEAGTSILPTFHPSTDSAKLFLKHAHSNTRIPYMNILMLAIDTLRADHLSCYGYRYPTSPTVDQLAQEGILFEKLICPVLPTEPSFTTLYTGQHPITHGIVSHGGSATLDRKIPLLPELLLNAGYTTCAVDNLASNKAWFARGYEFYIDPSMKRAMRLMVTAEEINHRAISWLKAYGNEKFFLFLHYWDPHTPYLPPPNYRELFYHGNRSDPANKSLEPLWRHVLGDVWKDTWFKWLGGPITDADYVRALYDQSIRYLDDQIKVLLGALNEIGVADDTLIVLLGDHGESMTEHGIMFEHHGLYEPTLHVPLILHYPQRLKGGRRIPQAIQHSDLAPTILDLAGIQKPESMEGKSFTSVLEGESQPQLHEKVISAESTWQVKWCLRTEHYKFILAREPDWYGTPMRELYDLQADAGELNNLIDSERGVAAEMEAELEGWIADRLKAAGRTIDPLIEQGVSLGKRWKNRQ